MPLGIYSQSSFTIIADECVLIFNCSASDIVHRRKAQFVSKLKYSSDNMLFKLLFFNIKGELLLIRCRRRRAPDVKCLCP